jgi:hypothetical protein
MRPRRDPARRPACGSAAIAVVAAFALLSAAPRPAHATRYYVRESGSDAADGRSSATAWRTIARANAADLEPGDRLMFEGGGRFAGRLEIGPEDAGTARKPVTVSSFGRGRATIEAGNGGGIFVHDAGGVRIIRLNVVGSGRAAGNRSDGISFYTDLAVPGSRLRLARVEHVEVSGFGKSGLILGGWAWDDATQTPIKTGFADVRFFDVDSHDNADAGILTYGSYGTNVSGWAHANVLVDRCRSHANPGIPGKGGNSGNGIVLVDVDGGRIVRSLAWDNGWLNDAPSGPIGIWAWDSNRVVIEDNEAWGNRLGTRDGGGFDLDGGATNCTMRRNTSHDNVGSGFLVYQFAGARPMRDNRVYDNRSTNDGRTNGGGLVVGGGAVRTTFERNHVGVGPRAPGAGSDGPYGVHVVLDGAVNVDTVFRDNVVATTGGVPVLVVPQPALQPGLLFEGNAWDAGTGPLAISWGASTYGSVEAWTAATGQGP